MKKYIVLMALALPAMAVRAQSELKGRVTDEAGNPLEGANLRDERSGRGTVSAASGEFFVGGLKPGQAVLNISFVGYETRRDTITLAAGKNEKSYALKPLPILVKPLEVNALRAGSEDPFAKNRVTDADIRKQNDGRDLPILLDQTPSIVTYSDAGAGVGYTYLRIRGADITRVNVTVDGIPVNDAESQGVFWVNTPDLASSVNDIQIQRGAGSSTNGGGAFGASLNVSTNKLNARPYVDMSASYGSFNTLKTTINAGTGLLANRFTVDARASRIVSDGYVDRASSRLQSFFVSGAYWGKKTTVRFNAFTGKEKTYQSWNGVPEYMLDSARTYNSSGTEKPGDPYANETDNYRQDYYRAFVTHAFNSKWSLNGALFLTRGKGFYENYKAGESLGKYGITPPVIGGDTVNSSDVVRQLWLDNYFYGATLSTQYQTQKVKLTLGGAYSSYDGRHYGRLTWAQIGLPEPDYQYYYLSAFKKDANLYAKINWQFVDHLFLYADVQYRYVNYIMNGFRNNPDVFRREQYHFVNPKLGLTWKISPADRLFVSSAIAQKEPNRDDFEVAGQSPKPEFLVDTELGYARSKSRYAIEVNAFYMYYRNQLIMTGKINDVGAYTRSNVPLSYRAGLEVQGSVKFLKIVTFSANATFSVNKIMAFTEYLDNYDLGGQEEVSHKNTDIAFSPDFIVGGTLSVNPVKGLTFDLVTKFVSRQYLDNTQNKIRSLNPFSVTDFRARYEFSYRCLKGLGLFVNLYNITNTRYEPNGATFSYISGGRTVTDNYYFPQARFHWSVGTSLKF